MHKSQCINETPIPIGHTYVWTQLLAITQEKSDMQIKPQSL